DAEGGLDGGGLGAGGGDRLGGGGGLGLDGLDVREPGQPVEQVALVAERGDEALDGCPHLVVPAAAVEGGGRGGGGGGVGPQRLGHGGEVLGRHRREAGQLLVHGADGVSVVPDGLGGAPVPLVAGAGGVVA